MDRRELKSFVAVASTGSFTRAAAALGLTQAAISQHVKRLEVETGPLFIRRPRKVELTPAGSGVLAYAAEIEAADRRLALRLTDTDPASGEVGLTSPGSIGLRLYPLLLDLQRQRPGLSIRHRFAPDGDVIEAVLDNRFELGLTARRPDDPRLTVSQFAREPLELIVPAGRKAEAWSDLEALGFIDHPDGQSMATRLFSQWYGRNPGIRALPINGFVNQIGLILEPVARGLGFTVLPRYAREAFGRPDKIAVVSEGVEIIDTLWLIHRSEWPLSARAEWVLDQVRGRFQ